MNKSLVKISRFTLLKLFLTNTKIKSNVKPLEEILIINKFFKGQNLNHIALYPVLDLSASKL